MCKNLANAISAVKPCPRCPQCFEPVHGGPNYQGMYSCGDCMLAFDEPLYLDDSGEDEEEDDIII